MAVVRMGIGFATLILADEFSRRTRQGDLCLHEQLVPDSCSCLKAALSVDHTCKNETGVHMGWGLK